MDHKKFKEFDQKFDLKLRPGNFTEFVGHKNIIERLQVVVQAAKGRGEALGHVLFHGPSGLGKTTLANILAGEMGSSLVTSTGPCIEKAGDLAGILTNLQERDFFFIDEIHRIPRSVEEYLYPAMEDFSLDLMIDSGPSARSVQVSLNRFTLIGATTKIGNLSAPLRSRFGLGIRLEFYTVEALTEIIQRSAKILQIPIDEKSAKEVAIRSRGTPRLANNLLCWIRDFAQLKNANVIDMETVFAASNMAEIDHRGLDAMDKRILKEIIEHHKGGPVGVKAIASSIGEDESTVSDVYEPYLIMQGFIRRTPRGREVTRLAYEHLGATIDED